ncbi:MAG: rhodanese-related sulfurtransferase [Roseivirga sp.]|jgi:rhodanese-related sulfurtransferase
MAFTNRNKRIFVMLSFIALSIILVVMNQNTIRLLYPKSISNISPKEAEALILDDQTLILDVREPVEYEVSHLPNALRYLPDLVSELKLNTPILVYCTVGVRSGKLAKELQKKGFTHVSNIDLGLINWKNKGFAVVDSKGQTTEKIHVYNRFFGLWLKNGEPIK